MVATELDEHKLCKTPANQCTLTLLPFDVNVIGEHLSNESGARPIQNRIAESGLIRPSCVSVECCLSVIGLDEFLVPMKLSPYAVARVVGVPRTRIERLVNGQTALTADTALRLAILAVTSS
jgi:hypothetical protein